MPQTQLNDIDESMKLTLTRSQQWHILRWKEQERTMRYAAYVRTNHRDETGNAYLMSQQEAIETWIAAQDGVLVEVYTDGAPGGRTADRPALRRMQSDASQGNFDGLVVHKPDRLSRNKTDLLAIQSLLREDHRIQLFAVVEQEELDTQYQQHQLERRYAATQT